MDSYLNQDVYPDWLAQDDDSTKPQGNGAEQAAPFFDLERLLDLPSPNGFSLDMGYSSSSPESSGSSHGAPAALDFGGEVSWEGILNRPIFPQASESSESDQSLSPAPAIVSFGGSPVTSVQTAPTPSSIPAGGFPPFSMASASGSPPVVSPPAPATTSPTAETVNPELAKLLASMASYNAQYGTLLPVEMAPVAPMPAPAPHAPLPATSTAARTSVASSSTSSTGNKQVSANSSAHTHSDEEEDEITPLRSVRASSMASSSSSKPQMSVKAAAKRVAGGHLMSSVVVEDETERGEGEEWRPTPEEYARLDSKQKRQLRNKISAKNFRNRRKDYIDKLEGHLGEKDKLLDFVREEMKRKEMENEELRREMAVLRNAVSIFNQTAFDVNGFTGSHSTAGSSQQSDSSPSTTFPGDAFSADSQAFWQSSFSLNPTIQTVALPPPSKPDMQPNLNPLLAQIPSLKQISNSLSPNTKPENTTFEQFADATPFHVRQATVDQYRNQLWSRLAREAAYASADEDKLALKPLFFNVPAAEVKAFGVPSSSSAASSSRGGIFASLYPPAPVASSASALIASHAASEKNASEDTAHLALLATVTQQTITSKLTSAFLDAFVVTSPLAAAAPSTKRVMDTDKMSSVISGKARLEVVPNTPATLRKTTSDCAASLSSGIEKALAALTLTFSGNPDNCPWSSRKEEPTAAAQKEPKGLVGWKDWRKSKVASTKPVSA